MTTQTTTSTASATGTASSASTPRACGTEQEFAALAADVTRRGFDEFRRFVNPLIANRAALAGEPVHVVRTEGALLVDDTGHAFEDFHGTQALGHRNPHITSAVTRWLATDAPNWFPSRVSPYAGRLARTLAERTGYDNAFFAMSGSDGVEAAIKLARCATGKPAILGLTGAYHGCAMGSTALMAEGFLHDRFGPHLPGVRKVPFGDVDALTAELNKGDVAMVLVEPVQGEGGVRKLPAPFVDALCRLTTAHGALLVADEVQTGFGRLGTGVVSTTSGATAWPRRPDAVILAKTIGGGLQPLSVLLTSSELFERAYGRNFASGESHNITFSYNAISMVAGVAALELLTDELIAGVRNKGELFRRVLEDKLSSSPLVEEIRGEGLMFGVKLKTPDAPWLSFEHFGFPELGAQSAMSPLLCHRLYPRGFFCFTCGHDWSVFRLQPRFAVPDDTLVRFATVCREELDALEALV